MNWREYTVKSIRGMVDRARMRMRARRAAVFIKSFDLNANTKILDLGSGDGSNIASIVRQTGVQPRNVFIADIDRSNLQVGAQMFGFVPVQLSEFGRLPFEDGFFDIVFCSSVIEHVTVPKKDVWSINSGVEFRSQALARQSEFAAEIKRIGKRYFVQTPNKWFPVESHTWLPFVGYLPRWVLVPLIKMTNRVWIKGTAPDWYLLSIAEMRTLFPDVDIVTEKVLGMTKSIMAVKK